MHPLTPTQIQAVLIALAILIVAVAIFLIFERFMRRRFGMLYPAEVELLRAQDAIDERDDQIAEMNHQAKNAAQRIEFLLSALQSANYLAERYKQELMRRGMDPEKIDAVRPPTPLRYFVLGIWPETIPALDLAAESDAVYNAGFEYYALSGAQATRAGVVRELDRVDYERHALIIEIGAHGTPAGEIVLTDGPTRPGWWARLTQRKQIEIMVLLACFSDDPTMTSTADALTRAGVRNVIAVTGSIPDDDAIAFARMFYSKLSTGAAIGEAVDTAKLVISDEGADLIRLRRAG